MQSTSEFSQQDLGQVALLSLYSWNLSDAGESSCEPFVIRSTRVWFDFCKWSERNLNNWEMNMSPFRPTPASKASTYIKNFGQHEKEKQKCFEVVKNVHTPCCRKCGVVVVDLLVYLEEKKYNHFP